jgi:tetratricopeptide (TPR) repeat protein
VAVFTLLYSFNLMVEKSAVDENFKTIRQVYNGRLFERQEYEKFDNELKVAQAFSYYENKQYETALEILLSTGEAYKNKLKFDLMGSIYFRSENFSESVDNFNESLRIHDKDAVTLNNFTLALLKENDEEVFDSYARRYPEIEDYRTKVAGLKNARISPTGLLWKRLVNFSAERFSFPSFLKNLLAEFFQLPIIYFILVFIAYIFGVRKFSPPIGGSTYCSKCSKIIKEASIHKSYKLCDECYQLFLIKDVIFLEAKILKEKELERKFKKKYALALIFSFFIPGLNLNSRGRNQLFVLLSCMFYFLLGFAVIGILTFNTFFSTAPIILNLVGMLAFVFYLVFNLVSILGDYNGF